MLRLMDLGCRKHRSCQVTLNGSEAAIVKNIIHNLPRAGESRTYICEYGQTHHVSFRGPQGEPAGADVALMILR
jgi:hypothetical protein